MPVKADMKITVPDEVFGVKKWETTVISNDNVATFIKELVLKLPEGENVGFEAGGYVQMEIPHMKQIINLSILKIFTKEIGKNLKFLKM